MRTLIKGTAAILIAVLLLPLLCSCNLFSGDESGDPYKGCGLVISEICSSNKASLQDSFGEYSDWIELYNGSKNDIDLKGFSITDDIRDKTKYSFGSLTIKAGEYLIVFASGRDIHEGAEHHTNFKVSATGETVGLYTPEGSELSIMTVPEMESDMTCGFDEDGKVVIFSDPTPGKKNSTGVYTPEVSENVNTDDKDKITIRINEYCTEDCVTLIDSEGDFSPWVELYNYGSEEVSLSGLYLSDNNSNRKKWAFPSITVKPGEYLVIFLAGKTNAYNGGELHATFTLTGDEDTLGIYNGIGTAIDEVAVYELFSNLSYGYSSSGAGEYVFFALATPGKVNSTTGFSNVESARKPINKSLVINEVVAVVQSSRSDYDCDFVELYNPTDAQIRLSDYYIGKKKGVEKAIQLPDITLNAGEYRLVFFGDETSYSSRRDTVTVDLGLNRYSNNIYIYNSEGICTDYMATGRLFDGVSCGLISMDSSDIKYFTTVTPNAANASVFYNGAIQSPEISLSGGYASAGTKITITAPAGATIYYTADGSTPTVNSSRYTGEITIDKTVTIQAIAYIEGYLPSDRVSASYVVGRTHDMAVVFLNGDYDDLFSEESGIYSEGLNFDSDNYTADRYGSLDDAFTKLVDDASKNANYFQDWEAAIRFDYIDQTGTQVLSFDAGAKAFGQYSRVRDQKSLSINLRDKYGMKEVCYPFFGDNYVNVFSSLVLRNSGQDGYRSHIRDAFVAVAIGSEMDVEVMAYRPVAVYINGEYWGIYDLRERINEDFIANHTGADPENVDLLKGTSIVLEGSITAYRELYNFVRDNDMSRTANYEKVCQMMDIDNYIDYWIAQLFFANTDTGNIKFYKEKTDDAKWRWIPYDFDWSLQSEGNFFSRTFEGSSQVFTIAKNLIKNDSFKERFITRFCYHLQTTLATDRLLAIYDALVSEIRSEMPYHIDRWAYRWNGTNATLRNLASAPRTVAVWENHVSTVRKYIQGRNDFITAQLQKYFGLSDSRLASYMDKSLY